MKKALAVLMLAGAAGTAFAQSPVRPARAGDVHLYSVEQRTERARYEESVTVTGVDAGQIRTRHVRTDRPEARDGVYGSGWGTVLKSGGSGSQYDPGVVQLPHPLKAGATWESTTVGVGATGARFEIRTQGTVVAQEKVRTPAGEYDAYRVEMKGYMSGLSFQGGFGYEQKLWYAPAIDAVVRTEYREQRPLGADTVSELKQFKPAD